MILLSDDLDFLRQQPLWTGCRETPYIIRSGVDIDKCLLYITDLTNSWMCKLERDQIIKDKELYNKSIQTTSFQGIIDLLELALKYDPQAEYTFKLNGNQLMYGYSNIIKIYTLTWVFNCEQLSQKDHQSIIKNDIFNSLLSTIYSLQNRCSAYKSALHQVEQDYLRRLNDKERQQYKSKDIDEDLKAYIQEELIEQNKICNIQFNESTNYFIKYYTYNKLNKQLQSKKRTVQQQEIPSQTNLNKKEKIIQAYQEALEDMIDNQNQFLEIKPHVGSKTMKKKGFL